MTIDYFSLIVFWMARELVERVKAMKPKRLVLKSRSAK